MVLQWPPHLTVFWSSLTCHQNNGTAVATPPNCVLVKSYLSPKQWYCSGHPTYLCCGQVLPVTITMVLQWPPHLTVFWSSLTCHQNNGTVVATPPNCVVVKSYLSPKQWYCSGHPTYLCCGQVLPVTITMVLQWPPHLTVFWSSLTCHQNNGTAVATPTWRLALACGTDWPGASDWVR